MSAYNVIQTGPKIQLGGFTVGFTSPAYQVGMAETVKIEPMTPANSEIMIAIINCINDFNFIEIFYSNFFAPLPLIKPSK